MSVYLLVALSVMIKSANKRERPGSIGVFYPRCDRNEHSSLGHTCLPISSSSASLAAARPLQTRDKTLPAVVFMGFCLPKSLSITCHLMLDKR